ncbi:hypothetical protein U1Q18_051062 [Sarracenia purpurea var. burkii]
MVDFGTLCFRDCTAYLFCTILQGGLFLLNRIVKVTTEKLISEDNAKEIEEFFASKDTSEIERTVNQSLETIRNNVQWLHKNADSVKVYLEKMDTELKFNTSSKSSSSSLHRLVQLHFHLVHVERFRTKHHRHYIKPAEVRRLISMNDSSKPN